jgi:hypothetical protein
VTILEISCQTLIREMLIAKKFAFVKGLNRFDILIKKSTLLQGVPPIL